MKCVSERDDIDVVEKAENRSAANSPAVSAGSNDITIRQDTPADEAKAKPGFLNRLKKAFSTEDDPQQENGGSDPLEEDEGLIGSLFGRFKKKSADESEPSSAEENTDSSEGEAPVEAEQNAENAAAAEIPEKQVKEEDPAEEEEFLMISAFLEGEEYTPADSAFDAHSALEDEEAVFEVDDENEDVAAYNEENTELTVLGDAHDGSDHTEEAKSDAPETGEKTADAAENSGADASEGGEAAASGEADSVAEAASDRQEADNSESKAAEGGEGRESDGESGVAAADAPGSAEDKAADTLEGQEEAPASEGVQAAADVNAAADGDAPCENGEAAANGEGDGAEPEKGHLTESLEDDDDEAFAPEEELLFDETDEELSDLASVDGLEDFGELTALFGEDDAESAPADKIPDTKEYGEEHSSEPLDKEEPKAEEAPSQDDRAQDKQESGAPAEITPENAENTENAGNTENSDNKEANDNNDAVAGEETKSETAQTDDKAEGNNGEQTAPEAVPAQTELPEKSDENDAEKAVGAEQEKGGALASVKSLLARAKSGIEKKPAQSGKTDDEKPQSAVSEADGSKSFFARTKDKLIELWNTKEDDEAAKAPQTAPVSDVLEEAEEDENDGWITGGEKAVIQEAPQEDGWVTGGLTHKENSEAKQPEKKEPETAPKPEAPKAEEKTEKVSEETPEKTAEEKAEQKESAEETPKPKTPVISIIKNDNAAASRVDEDKLRESLNVIERDDTDVLTEEQKKALETNKKVLERVQALEQETAQAREELRREAVEREAKEAAAAVVTELEVTDYRPARGETVKFSAGRFTDSVRSEYDCIVNYKRMRSVSTKAALITEAAPVSAAPASPAAKETPLPDISQSSIPEFKEARDFERNHDKVDSICKKLDYQDERDPEPVEYRCEEDANAVRKHVTAVRRRESWVCGAALGITLASFIFSCFAGRFTVGNGADSTAALQRIYAVVNLLMYAGILFCCRNIIINGLKPLKRFKANPDTGVALAAAAAAFQALLAVILPTAFLGQGQGVYTLIVMLTLSVCCAGRYMNADRISANFRFVSDTVQKYAGKFFPDQRMVAKLLSGTKNDKTELSFQKKTSFLKHFMRLSRAEDPGDKLAATFALPALILSLFVALIAGIASKSFLDAWSVLCVMLCAGIPISSRALAAVPLHRLSKKALVNKSMIVGYSAVETFSDSAAVMIDSKDLYPAGSIQMNDFKAIDTYRWQDGIYAAAAVTIAAGGAMAGMFDGMIDKKTRESLPSADGVMYEDGKGLIGWVNNERICVGNRTLMKAHGILAPAREEEEVLRTGGSEPLYIAMSGQLVGILLVSYTANHRVSDVLKRMEASDMSMLVRTTDVNITAERIARDFGVGIKSIKVLEQKGSNVIRDEMVGKEKASPAFIATKGGVTSFGLAVSECIQTKRNISLSLAVEIVGALLKILVVTAIVLFAGIHHVGAIQLFLFSIFWVAAVLCAPIVVQKFQDNF